MASILSLSLLVSSGLTFFSSIATRWVVQFLRDEIPFWPSEDSWMERILLGLVNVVIGWAIYFGCWLTGALDAARHLAAANTAT